MSLLVDSRPNNPQFLNFSLKSADNISLGKFEVLRSLFIGHGKCSIYIPISVTYSLRNSVSHWPECLKKWISYWPKFKCDVRSCIQYGRPSKHCWNWTRKTENYRKVASGINRGRSLNSFCSLMKKNSRCKDHQKVTSCLTKGFRGFLKHLPGVPATNKKYFPRGRGCHYPRKWDTGSHHPWE